jgi:hypothetical protein
MRTNREKYEHYCAIIAAGDQQVIDEIIPAMPAQFYIIKAFGAVPVEVTHLSVYRRGIYKHGESDRVTKDEVELAKQYVLEWTEPTLDSIHVHYRQKQSYGTVTGAHPYSKIEGAVDMAWQAADLAPEIERRRELYAPRDGHAACGYCQKQTTTESLVNHMIYYRDQGGSKTKIGKYCSAQCGYHDQCGHEG